MGKVAVGLKTLEDAIPCGANICSFELAERAKINNS